MAEMSTPGPSSESKPQKSLNRQFVLEEDEYTAALSNIIARDFFPSLVHLDAANNYLDALRSDDPQLINASVRQLQELATPATGRAQSLQTPSQTPWAGEPSDTPLRTPAHAQEPPTKRARYDSDMSLDSFQARYTSEDNSSFTEILDDENRKRRERWDWAWDAQKRVEAQRERMLEAREKLLIEPAAATGVREKFVIEAPRPVGLITAEGERKGKNKDSDVAKDTESESTALVKAKVDDTVVDVMAPKKDTRPAGVDGWHFRARNAFMFPPDADMSPYDPQSSVVPATGNPKVIMHANTRLPEQEDAPSSGLSEPPSPTRSRIEAAIQGTPYRPRSPTSNNLSLLPSMPSPTPSELGPAAVKQLMTWGTLNATPRILKQTDDPADPSEVPEPDTPFRIAAPTARETVAHKLSANAAKSLRAKAALMSGNRLPRGFGLGVTRTPSSVRGSAADDGSMAPPNWTPRKAVAAGALTPAARRLLDRTTSVAGARRADAMGKTANWEGSSKAKERDLNRVRWTPSPAAVARKR